MSIRIVGYYLIQPRPEFSQWLYGCADRGLVDELLETRLFEHHESIGRAKWGDEENALHVKLLFVASLCDLEPLKDANTREQILGSFQISPGVFDRWWTMRRLRSEGPIEEFTDNLQSVIEHVPATTNDAINVWLANLRAT